MPKPPAAASATKQSRISRRTHVHVLGDADRDPAGDPDIGAPVHPRRGRRAGTCNGGHHAMIPTRTNSAHQVLP